MPGESTFTFAKPEHAQMAWRRDRWHVPDAVTVFATDSINMVQNGFQRGMGAAQFPVAMEFQVVNGYLYMGVGPARPSGLPPLGNEPQPERLDNHKAWDEIWLPEIQGYHARWAAFDRENATPEQLVAHIEESLVWAERCWEVHARLDFSIDGLLAIAGAELGWDMPRTQRMVAGLPSKSMESDEELRKLADRVRASSELSESFKRNAPEAVLAALPANEEAANFRKDLGAFLAEFGRRFDNEFDSASPSWIEDPTPVMAVIRAYVSQPARDHQAMRDKLTQAREEAIAEARRLLADRPQEVREAFEVELSFAQRATELNETHNFWIDQQATYWTQQNFLAAGRTLVARGIIEAERDIFHLHMSEILDGLRGNTSSMKADVVSRKAELARFQAMEAPLELGAPTPPEISGMLDGIFGGHKRSDVSTEVHGQAASPGAAIGTARVILSLKDSDRIEEGDILVTKTTSPPWTPLFGIVSAVVTDAGGALSHCAIVAREYAIPAVVGCVDATEKIADGARIRVDGDTGVVTLL